MSNPQESEPLEKGAQSGSKYGSGANDEEAGGKSANQSLWQQLKDAQRSATSRQDYMRKSGQAVYNHKATLLMLALFLPIPISMIIVGAINITNCPVQPLIPIWMIVAGAVFLVMKAAALLDKCINRNNLPYTDEDTKGSKALRFFESLCSLFSVAWLICGSVWVFSIYRPDLDDSESLQYCDRGLYLYAFALLIIVYVVMMLFCCCCGGICCVPKSDD